MSAGDQPIDDIEGDDDDPGEVSGGCGTSQGGSSAWLPMLALLGLMLRRRRLD